MKKIEEDIYMGNNRMVVVKLVKQENLTYLIHDVTMKLKRAAIARCLNPLIRLFQQSSLGLSDVPASGEPFSLRFFL